ARPCARPPDGGGGPAHGPGLYRGSSQSAPAVDHHADRPDRAAAVSQPAAPAADREDARRLRVPPGSAREGRSCRPPRPPRRPGAGGGPSAAAPPAGPAPAAPPAESANSDQLYHEAFKKLQDGDYPGAERGFKSFLQSNPRHVLAGNAQYWLGETYYARRDYQNAMTAFAEGYKVYKTSPKGPDNLLKLGITLAALGRKTDACEMFAKYNQDYPRATDLQKRRIEQERQKSGCG